MLDDPELDAQAAPFASPSPHTYYAQAFEDPRYLIPHDAATTGGAQQDDQSHRVDPCCVDPRDYRREGFPDYAAFLNPTIDSIRRTSGLSALERSPQSWQLPPTAESVVGGVHNVASTPGMINGTVCLLSVLM
jgi:hypothetical protein